MTAGIPRLPDGRIFLTGATGFIGRALLRALLEAGATVTALVRGDSDAAASTRLGRLGQHPRVRVVRGDLLAPSLGISPEDLHGVRTIIHSAAWPKLGPADEGLLRRLHVEAVATIADLADRLGVSRVLHLSTAFVSPYPNGWLGETWACGAPGANAYERTKTEGETLVARRLGWRVEILRPGIVLPGPESDVRILSSSPLGIFFDAAFRRPNATVRIPGDPAVRPGFSRLGDLVRFALGRLASPHAGLQFWNLVPAGGPRLAELAHEVRAAAMCGAIEFVRRDNGPLFRPWAPYFMQQRSWECELTQSAAEQAGGTLRPIELEEFANLARAWRPRQLLEGAA